MKLDHYGLVVRAPTKHPESNWGLRVATLTAFGLLPIPRAQIVPHDVVPALKLGSKQDKNKFKPPQVPASIAASALRWSGTRVAGGGEGTRRSRA